MADEPKHDRDGAAPDASNPAPTAAARRAAALRAAAQAKQQAAVVRAEAGLRAMVKTGQPIEFRALARIAGVSVNFLYNHHELRSRIQQLQDQHEHVERPEPRVESSDSAILRSLTAKLRGERRRRLDEVALLREQLAAAHGELLRIRRASGIADRDAPLRHE